MFIRIERGSSIPISRQIAEQIRAQCLSGDLKAGDCLPPVRRLAKQLAVNVNTVLRVYERLAADHLIEMRHGDGTYVMPQSNGASSVRQLSEQREQYTREFNALVGRGLLLGLRAAELRRMLTEAVAAEKREHQSASESTSRDSTTKVHSN